MNHLKGDRAESQTLLSTAQEKGKIQGHSLKPRKYTQNKGKSTLRVAWQQNKCAEWLCTLHPWRFPNSGSRTRS